MSSNGEVKIAESQTEVVIATLLQSLPDKSSTVSEALHSSLRKIAKNHPNEVVKISIQLYSRNPQDLITTLEPVKFVCLEHLPLLDEETIDVLISFLIMIIIQAERYKSNAGEELASSILVSLGSKHYGQVMDQSVKNLIIEDLPQFGILTTLGSLASSNAFGFVGYLKDVLNMVMPHLNRIKDFNKKSFAYALGCFSDALKEYLSSTDQEMSTITVDMFYMEMDFVCDVLCSWLQSRDVKVNEDVLYALSAIFGVLSVEKVNQQIPKVLPVILSSYKRQNNLYPVTLCLCSMIKVATQVNGTILEPHLSNILHTLQALVSVLPDYANLELVRNHSEVLRCYQYLVTHYTDHCLDKLIAQMRSSSERERIKSLIVLKHLINTANNSIQNKLGVITSLMQNMLNDPSLKIKKALVETIVALIYNSSLAKANEEQFIDFIIKTCCDLQVRNRSDNLDASQYLEMQLTSRNSLFMLTSSSNNIEETLWKLLISYYLKVDYSDCCVSLLQCLIQLIEQNKGFNEVLFLRSLALLAQPLANNRGTHLLNFIKHLNLSEKEDHRTIWASKIQNLFKYLDQNSEDFNQKEWEGVVLDFLKAAIDSSENNKFLELLLDQGKVHTHLYSAKRDEKLFLIKCMAVASSHLKDASSVDLLLENILQNIVVKDFSELLVCAEAFGICSKFHVKFVLQKVHNIRKEFSAKKSHLFNFMRDSGADLEVKHMRYMVVVSMAEICALAPIDTLLLSIEHEMMDFVVEELKISRSFDFIYSCIHTIGCIADVMHPSKSALHICLRSKQQVIDLVSAQLNLNSGPEFVELLPVILTTLISLIRLPPNLESLDRIVIIKKCFELVYGFAGIYSSADLTGGGDAKYSNAKLSVQSSGTKLNSLMEEFVIQCPTLEVIQDYIDLLTPWLNNNKAVQRHFSLKTLFCILQTVSNNSAFAYKSTNCLPQMAGLLALLIPRCADANKNIRKVAVDCLSLTLCIISHHEGCMKDYDKIINEKFVAIKENIDTDDANVLYDTTIDLAKIVINHLPNFQLAVFIDKLINALTGSDPSSYGSSIILNVIIENKGGDLFLHVVGLLNKIISQLNHIQHSRTKSTSLLIVHSFACHHLKATVDVVLAQTLSTNSSINDCWSVLTTDSVLARDVLEYLMERISNCALFDNENDTVASLLPLQIIYAMGEIFRQQHMREISRQKFPELFVTFLIILSSYISSSAKFPIVKTEKKPQFPIKQDLCPRKICLDTFKSFLVSCGNSDMVTSLDNYKENDFTDFLDIFPILVHNIGVTTSENLSWLVAHISPYGTSELESQRIAMTAFLVAILSTKQVGHYAVYENILEMLLTERSDSNALIKLYTFRGLGHAVECLPQEMVARYCENILGILMQGLDYYNQTEHNVILEAVLSFSKLLKMVNKKQLQTCHVTAAVRIRPLFDHEEVTLRRSAFILLGDLANSLTINLKSEAFKEQIHANLITLLLHLGDGDLEVVRACKQTLKKVCPFLNCPQTNEMIQTHLIDEATLHYSEFITDLIKIMAEELQELFPQLFMTSLSYLKSNTVDIRSHSILLAGVLYSHMNADSRTHISFDTVCCRFLQLLKDSNEQVRVRAAEAIAYLFTS